jgi:hypothetical protein
MTATILKLLPDDEVRILQTYIGGLSDSSLEIVYDTLNVPTVLEPTRNAVAVAQILLNQIQASLPNWMCVDNKGVLIVNQLLHHRLPGARLNFNPQHVCTINWADSGPGFSWPEAYYVTYLPRLNCHVVTASQDGSDAYGSSDHAIGFIKGASESVDAAKQIIINFWVGQRSSYDQQRWAYLFNEGLINEATAQAWADEAWPEEVYDEDGELS